MCRHRILSRSEMSSVAAASSAYSARFAWSELIGADAVISPPAAWQRRFNASDIEIRPRIDDPVDPAAVDQLLAHFPDFGRAYSVTGLAGEEFDSFAPTVRTLRQFIAACSDLAALVRDVMLPDPR
jgi:transaldolase